MSGSSEEDGRLGASRGSSPGNRTAAFDRRAIPAGAVERPWHASDGHAIRTRVVNGGVVSDRKGVNVPDAVLPIPALTAKDRRDLDFALERRPAA